MDSKRNHHSSLWQVIGENLTTVVTIVTAVLALVLMRLDLLPDRSLPSVIITLLALLATTHLIDSRRMLENLDRRLDNLTKHVESKISGVNVRQFDSADSAIEYLAEKIRKARICVDQASIDKQRARKTDSRLKFEKAREDLIISDRVMYRYIGIVDLHRRFRAIKSLIMRGPLNNFYAAFGMKLEGFVPLMSFTVIDKEEVFARVPYEIGEEPQYFAIQSKEVACLFIGYFNKIWECCQKVEKVEEIDEMLDSLQSERFEVKDAITRHSH